MVSSKFSEKSFGRIIEARQIASFKIMDNYLKDWKMRSEKYM